MKKGKITLFELLIIIYFVVLSGIVWGYDILWCGFKELIKGKSILKLK